jgi:hypothetical protein
MAYVAFATATDNADERVRRAMAAATRQLTDEQDVASSREQAIGPLTSALACLDASSARLEDAELETVLAVDALRASLLARRARAYLAHTQWTLALRDATAALPELETGMTACVLDQVHAMLCLQRPDDADALLSSLPRMAGTGKAVEQKSIHVAFASLELRVQQPLQLSSNDAANCPADDGGSIEAYRAITQQALLEKHRGAYHLPSLLAEAAVSRDGTLSRLHSDFESPHIEVVHLAHRGGGRGVRARIALPALTLVMAHKAFAFARAPAAASASSADSSARAAPHVVHSACSRPDLGPLVLGEIVRQLALNPERRGAVFDLRAGSAPERAQDAAGGDVAVAQLNGILYNNWFGVTRHVDEATQYAHHLRMARSSSSSSGGDEGLAGAGLFLRAGLLNHSCAPNCFYRTIGDFIFLMTARAVAAGEELFQAYVDPLLPFEVRARELAEWNRGDGFQCDCARCVFVRARPAVARLESRVCTAHRAVTAARLGGSQAAVPDVGDEQCVAEMRATLEALPLVHQAPLFLLDDMSGPMTSVDSLDELARHEHAIRVQEAIGLSRSWAALRSRLSVVRCALDAVQLERARIALESAFEAFCGDSAMGSLSAADFALLAAECVGSKHGEMVDAFVSGCARAL